jgi:hypothetical protein
MGGKGDRQRTGERMPENKNAGKKIIKNKIVTEGGQ